MLKWVPDELYLKVIFKGEVGYSLNLTNPSTYNEKLQWLKLHDRNPQYTNWVDKYEVKRYISKKIGEQYLIPTIGVWNSVDDIDFDRLPEQFVLKCTHDSGSTIVCKNKEMIDSDEWKKFISSRLKNNAYYSSREWPYKNVKPRIIAEQYMEDESGYELKDYKVLCFEGKPRLIEVHKGRKTRNHSQDFYDLEWNLTPITNEGLPNSSPTIQRPSVLEEMINLSTILAEGIHHIRVDWYVVNEKLYFGELTFFDGAGFSRFDKIEHDRLLGSWIHI